MSAGIAAWDVLARAAAAREVSSAGRPLRELLVFELDGGLYALPVERVREIVRARSLTAVPRTPAEVLGVIVLRGEIVQVLDLRQRLGLAPAAPTRATRVIVLHGDDGDVTGLLVDGVREVLRVEEGALAPPAGDARGVAALARKGERFVSLLSVERVVDFDGAR
jgi:purine-binding chemotaxis protein CheW